MKQKTNVQRPPQPLDAATLHQTPEQHPEMAPRRSKRVGRPRLTDSSEAILSEDRRTQVRRAQRKYRLKKEAIFQDATARTEQLEAKMRTAAEETADLSQAFTEAQLHLSHPDIHARLKRIHDILADADSTIEKHSPTKSSPGSPVRQALVSNAQVKSPGQHPLPRPLPASYYTYAFQEVRFARQLQRYCLEYAYRLFAEDRSDPSEVYRVFRLVSCVRDPGKTKPRFQQLLMGGRMDPLEVPGLPFYSIGGAGTHFPDVDVEGNAIYPTNSRMPRRVLGLLPWPELGNKTNGDHLKVYGLGGDWFDSRDVEGYLRLHGVDINESLFPPLRMPSGAATKDGLRSYVLDVEGFFSRLLSRLVILGRAPGFRKTDVKSALQASVKKVDHA